MKILLLEQLILCIVIWTIGAMGAMMPQITDLDVKCGRSGMTVHLTFDRSFSGVVYSKGHYSDRSCNYVTEGNNGKDTYMFNIPKEGCGTTGELEAPTQDSDMYYENTIIVQNDALIQEEWDTARRIRCVWKHTMRKSISASPFKILEPKKVSLELNDQSVKTLMEIHGGGGNPFTSPATGYIHLGEESSIVIYVQEPTGKLDANVVSCRAETGKGEILELVDEKGCVVRPELMTQFSKTREVTGVIADLMLYSYFKGFQISDSSKHTISCRLEVCRGRCSSPCQKSLKSRVRRQADYDVEVEEATVGNPPSAVIDLSKGVVVVTKQQVPDLAKCGLDSTVTIAISCLSGLVIALSLLSCCLTSKIRTLQRTMSSKPSVNI